MSECANATENIGDSKLRARLTTSAGRSKPFKNPQNLCEKIELDHFRTPYCEPAHYVLRSYPTLLHKVAASLAVAVPLLGSVTIQSCVCALTEVGVE